MSVSYRAISWTPFKRQYDLVLALAVVVYIGALFVGTMLAHAPAQRPDPVVFTIRATASAAFILLHVVLVIGPLARLKPSLFLPLLYNRRHLGVTTFLLAFVHGLLVLGYYHGFGVVSPVRSLLTSNTAYGSTSAFPFEIFGVATLLVLLVMAVTSHDFWLKLLSPGVWKAIHMAVYPAWASAVLHVLLGWMRDEKSPVYSVTMVGGAVVVIALHLIAGVREVRRDRIKSELTVGEPAESHGVVLTDPAAERVAVFRHNGKRCGLENVCAHQGGPLGEGRIVDGCVTCPWHGYQYRPETGDSPPPFTEHVEVKHVDDDSAN